MIYLHFKDKDLYESGVSFLEDISFRISLAKEYMKNNPDLKLVHAFYYFNGIKFYFENELQ